MIISDLKSKFAEIDIAYSKAIKDCLADCHADEETKRALNEIAIIVLDAIGETQDSVIEYLNNH